MAKTTVLDIFEPHQIRKYSLRYTAEKNEFYICGVVAHEPAFDLLAAGGGRTVSMPGFDDLSGDRQILSETQPIAVGKITTHVDIAAIHNDSKAWGSTDLAKTLSDADPLAAIAMLTGGYWSRADQKMLIASCKGVCASPSMASNVLSIAAESVAGRNAATTCLNGQTFVDATALLGDAGDLLRTVAMHSLTEASLRKQQLIETIPSADGKLVLKFFQGRRVIVDDGMPVRAGLTDGQVFTTYLFADGVFAKGISPLEDEPVVGGIGTWAVESYREPLSSDSGLINRRRHILHPRGVKWAPPGEISGISPTNVELEDGANWTRVWEPKQIRMVAIHHNN